MARCCEGKIRYPSAYAAVKAARAIQHYKRDHTIPVVVYGCACCAGFHYGRACDAALEERRAWQSYQTTQAGRNC